jgi:hypothetical protein
MRIKEERVSSAIGKCGFWSPKNDQKWGGGADDTAICGNFHGNMRFDTMSLCGFAVP